MFFTANSIRVDDDQPVLNFKFPKEDSQGREEQKFNFDFKFERQNADQSQKVEYQQQINAETYNETELTIDNKGINSIILGFANQLNQ